MPHAVLNLDGALNLLSWQPTGIRNPTEKRAMTEVKPEESAAEILARLLAEARRLWGEERAQELRTSLQQTADNLHQIATHLHDSSVGPGFYQ